MKKIFTIIITFFVLVVSWAQEYTPMLEPGKIWNMKHIPDYGSPDLFFNLEVMDTVVINGIEYQRIVATCGNEAYLREDIEEKKVYCPYEDGEWALYDFTLEVGDLVWGGDSPQEIVAIGYGDFYGMENLRYYELANGDKLIEGIGYEHYGIGDAYIYDENDICYSDYGISVLIGMNQPLMHTDDREVGNIDLSPNPVKDILNITYHQNANIQKITVCDFLGNTLLVEDDHFAQLDLSDMPGGILLLKIETENGVFTKKIIKE